MKYLLMTRGLYWRPERKGYSSHVLDAGLYDEAEAKSIAGDRGDGTVDEAIPLADKRDEVVRALADATRHVEAGTAMLKECLIPPVDDGVARCSLCGYPMPPGEDMFKYHGYSGPCPAQPVRCGGNG